MNDKTAIPLSEDDSNGCTFKEDVNEFLDKYSQQQNVPFSYIEKLVSHRNFALITLLIAVANYGVVDIPKDSDLKSKDPLVAANEIDVDDGFENFMENRRSGFKKRGCCGGNRCSRVLFMGRKGSEKR